MSVVNSLKSSLDRMISESDGELNEMNDILG